MMVNIIKFFTVLRYIEVLQAKTFIYECLYSATGTFGCLSKAMAANRKAREICALLQAKTLINSEWSHTMSANRKAREICTKWMGLLEEIKEGGR